MAKYTGTPLSSPYNALERRRAVNKALLEQALSPYEQKTISGYAVPAWGEAIGKIAQGYAGGKWNRDTDVEEESLSDQFDAETASSAQRVMEALQGRGNTSESGPVRPIAPDPDKAQMMAATDPYLSKNRAVQALMNARIKADAVKQGRGGSPYYTNEYGANSTLQTNARTGEQKVIPYPEGFSGRDRYDPELHRRLSQQKQLGLGGAELETDPLTAGAVRQSEADVDVVMKPEIKKQVDLAERDAEKIIAKPKVESTLSAADTKTEMLDGTIDQAIDQTGAWTAGFLGSATSWVPGTPAHNLGATLSTVKANIGFDKLQEMRNNSPTGGALGQVSEFENKLLQSVWGALEQSQSPAQLKENLEKVRAQSKESWARIREAYKQDYGEDYIGPSGGGDDAGAPKVGDVVDGYRFLGGDPSNQSNWEEAK